MTCRLPVPRKQLSRERISCDEAVRTQHDEKASDFLLEDNDECNESQTHKLSKDGTQQLHLQYADENPVKHINGQQPDKDVDGHTTPQQTVQFVQQKGHDADVKKIDQPDCEEAYVEKIHSLEDN